MPFDRLLLGPITELSPPKSWTVRGVGGPTTAIAKGTVEPLDDGARSRVAIAFEFEAHGAGSSSFHWSSAPRFVGGYPSTWKS